MAEMHEKLERRDDAALESKQWLRQMEGAFSTQEEFRNLGPQAGPLHVGAHSGSQATARITYF
jgi:hypothetical protein